MRLITSIFSLLITLLLRCHPSSQLQCYRSLNGEPSETLTCQHQYTHTLNTSSDAGQINVTFSHHHPEAKNVTDHDFKHCLILQYSDPEQQDETGCDFNDICDNTLLQENTAQLVKYNGLRPFLYCCTEDHCNADSKLEEIRTNPPQLACTDDGYRGSQMIVTKRVPSKPHYANVLVYTCEDPEFCKKNQLGTNQCKNITDGNGPVTEMCCCDSMSCATRPTTSTVSTTSDKPNPTHLPLASTPLAPMPTNEDLDHMQWKFVAGIICALVLALLVLLAIGLVIKKYRTYKSSVTYSYNQLTADFAEEGVEKDDSMIVG